MRHTGARAVAQHDKVVACIASSSDIQKAVPGLRVLMWSCHVETVWSAVLEPTTKKVGWVKSAPLALVCPSGLLREQRLYFYQQNFDSFSGGMVTCALGLHS